MLARGSALGSGGSLALAGEGRANSAEPQCGEDPGVVVGKPRGWGKHACRAAGLCLPGLPRGPQRLKRFVDPATLGVGELGMGNGGRVDVRLAWFSGLAGYGLRRHGWLRPAVSVGLHVCVGAVWTTGRASPSWLDWVEGRLCFYGWPSVRAWGECYALTRTYEISGDNEVEQQAMFGEKHMLSSIEEFPADLASGPGPVPAEPVFVLWFGQSWAFGLARILGATACLLERPFSWPLVSPTHPPPPPGAWTSGWLGFQG